MKVNTLKNPQINQNGYHKNVLTKERIGTLFIYPIDFTPDDCLSCEGYSLQISDYEDLYKVIGTKFNKSGDASGTFRIPDYNVTGRFLQPNKQVGVQIESGLPQHNHTAKTTTAGAHTHTRGSMNIVGEFYISDLGNSGIDGSWSSGAFSLTQPYERGNNGQTLSGKGTKISFDASKNWTGSTSSAGGHTHSITIDNASGSIYGSTSVVQPPSQTVHICIKYK